jgi:type I restriction enzyme M protein
MDDELLLRKSLRGIEKKPMPHMLCVTNLILHDVDVPLIERGNALSRRPLRDYGPSDEVDVIVTNPPFGGTEEPGVESNFPRQFQTKETADLFLALIMKRLKMGGKGAIVLPDGSLFGEGVKTRLKERLMGTCNLHTIVRLPNGVFAPYTGINTNLLFFTKGEPTREVWYFEHPLPADRKQYSKTRPIELSEFDLEKGWWEAREENEHAWRVTLEEMQARGYNLDIKNPHAEDEGYGDPDRLLAVYEGHLERAAELRGQLKAELAAALERVVHAD